MGIEATSGASQQSVDTFKRAFFRLHGCPRIFHEVTALDSLWSFN
jgi:hypothetical protein